MAKIHKELLAIMNDYNLFMDSDKQMELPIAVTHEKSNHASSLYIEKEIHTNQPLGHNSFDCEVRNKDIKNYSFQLLTDALSNRVLFRLDEGNGAHRNNIPDIPLEHQSVPTPHFHRYDSKGHFLAYKSKELKEFGSIPLSIQDGISLFCKEGNIHPESTTQTIGISVQENGNIPSAALNDTDPLNGINF